MNKHTKYKFFEDAAGTVWAAESEDALRDYDNAESDYGDVEWPVTELSDAEIDRRSIDCTPPPDADEDAPDFKRNIVSLRSFIFENILPGTGVQVVSVLEDDQ
jgi:hypothetical protein